MGISLGARGLVELTHTVNAHCSLLTQSCWSPGCTSVWSWGGSQGWWTHGMSGWSGPVCTDLSWRGLCPDRVYTTSEQGASPARGALTYHTLCCLAAQAGFLSKISVEMQKPQNLEGFLCLRSLGSSLGQALPVLRDRNESDFPRKSNVA